MKRGLIFLGLVAVILASSAGSAFAHEVTQYNRYSQLWSGWPQYTSDANTAKSWLNNTDYYKGRIWASGPIYDWQVRYRSVMFDHRSTSNWLGYGYANNSAKVLECQRALAYLGYNPWSNQDGIWGSTTYNAVKGFQSANGLSSDGIVGRVTWNHMVFDN